MPQAHYTVGYHDVEQHHLEVCEYAENAYEAIEHSKEDVSYLKEHPHFIDYCMREEWKQWITGQWESFGGS